MVPVSPLACRMNLVLIFLVLSGRINAQNDLPVIRAHSKVVDIIDGENLKKGWWQIMPERKPDIYYVSIPHRPHRSFSVRT